VTCAFTFIVGRFNSPPSTAQVVGDQTYMVTEVAENRKLTVTFDPFEDQNSNDSLSYEVFLYEGDDLINSGFLLNHVSDLVLDISCTDNAKAGAYTVELRVTDDNRSSASNGVQSGSLSFELLVTVLNHAPTAAQVSPTEYTVVVGTQQTVDFPSVSDLEVDDVFTRTCHI